MLYRLCKEEEICQIATNNFFEVGKEFIDNPKFNSFHYLEGVKYVHFFDEKNSLYYLNGKKGYYVCTYDIPQELLYTSKGYGYYLDFINYRNLEKVKEYAIPNYFIKFEYLKTLEKLTDDMDYDLPYKSKIIFDKNKVKEKRR